MVMVLKAMLVDSDPVVRDKLRTLLAKHSAVEVVGAAPSLRQARRLLQLCTPDLLFLATELADGSGFDLLCDISPTTCVAFAADDPRHAIRAFEVNAFDYLLKPMTPGRVAQSIGRLRRLREGASPSSPPPSLAVPAEPVVIEEGGRRQVVQLAEVAAVTAFGGNYTQLCRVDGEVLEVRRTIKQWESMLPQEQFVRVHRAAIVNLEYLEQVGKRASGALTLRVRSVHEPIAVSRRRSQRLNEFLQRQACA
jgi:two-component system LytT family response regulator